MRITYRWNKEPGPRLQGSRDLDHLKVQAPCIVRNPSGGFRLFYTAVGPAKPYPSCQGYILSAVSDDGLVFRTEPGIRVAPQPALPHMSLRVIAPTITICNEGGWRMYFESRGAANLPTVICSAISSDMIHWEHEEGIRLQGLGGFGGPRYLSPLLRRIGPCGAVTGTFAGAPQLSPPSSLVQIQAPTQRLAFSSFTRAKPEPQPATSSGLRRRA